MNNIYRLSWYLHHFCDNSTKIRQENVRHKYQIQFSVYHNICLFVYRDSWSFCYRNKNPQSCIRPPYIVVRY